MTTLEFDFEVNECTNKNIAIVIALRNSVGMGLKKAKELVDNSKIDPLRIRMDVMQFGIFMAVLYERKAEEDVYISYMKTCDEIEKILYDFTGK
jgi:hypothetical protein